MSEHDPMLMERPAADTPAPTAPRAGPKTILVHLQDDDTLFNRLENALSLTRSCNAHLRCLHVTPYEAYVAYEGYGGVFVMSDVMRTIDERNAALQDGLEKKLAGEDVSWDFVHSTGSVLGQILSHGALADLIVSGRESQQEGFARQTIGLLGDIVSRSRTPLLIPSRDRDSIDLTGPALIGWDGSMAAADAVRAALPMLKLAASVRILRVIEDKAEEFPPTGLLEYLSRHDIHAELSTDTPPDRQSRHAYVAAALMGMANEIGAAFLVMGGYNHSRLGEYVFGGVTRTLLNDCTVPIVIAH